MQHWAADYIGMPWDAQHNDCWMFVRAIWETHFGFAVPAIEIDSASALACRRTFAAHAERMNWIAVQEPAEGDGVLMGTSARPSHVGVWVAANGGAVLHCLQDHGVVCQNVTALKSMGLHVIGYYRRADRE